MKAGIQQPLIKLENINKVYPMDSGDVSALKNIDLEIREGEMLAIIGPSGSGKSTLMNILGCMDNPTAGSYYLDGDDVGSLNKRELAAVRKHKLGFVFQKYNLLARSTAEYNVQLPLFYAGCSGLETRLKAAAALEAVGLQEHAQHRPSQMSGGQQQRVAIARAMINDPVVLLADEPTGALDSVNSHEIMKLFQKLNGEAGVTVIIITHEMDVAAYCPRQVVIRDGMIIKDSGRATEAIRYVS